MPHRRQENSGAWFAAPDLLRLMPHLRHPDSVLSWIKVIESRRVRIELVSETEDEIAYGHLDWMDVEI